MEALSPLDRVADLGAVSIVAALHAHGGRRGSSTTRNGLAQLTNSLHKGKFTGMLGKRFLWVTNPSSTAGWARTPTAALLDSLLIGRS